jgi:hypothetical protein
MPLIRELAKGSLDINRVALLHCTQLLDRNADRVRQEGFLSRLATECEQSVLVCMTVQPTTSKGIGVTRRNSQKRSHVPYMCHDPGSIKCCLSAWSVVD